MGSFIKKYWFWWATGDGTSSITINWGDDTELLWGDNTEADWAG